MLELLKDYLENIFKIEYSCFAMVKINKRAYPLYMITLLYFLLGFINILFAYLAIACMALPFILTAKSGRKIWCAKWCPRADYLSLFRPFERGLKAPSWLNSGNTRKLVLQFFCINLFFVAMSTFMVSRGEMLPMEHLRFLIALQLSGPLPQLLETPAVAPWVIHLAYRLYSIMFTSTVLGTLLALFYKPRTWCAVCPVNTLTTSMVKRRSH